jgi:hypothetical protein
VARYDWEYLRHKYVAGDATLDDLAAPNDAPALDTLKKRSARDGWAEERAAYRHQTSTRTREFASVSEAEVAARHVKLAKALQHKGLERLATLKPEELSPRDLLAYIKEATDIERKALGLDTIRMTHLSKPPSDMTDDELREAVRALATR